MLEIDIKLARDDFQLNLAATIGPGVTAIFGSSGSGKTSLLKAIAGLVPVQGHISFMGTTWLNETQQTPPYLSPIGLLCQEDRLFAHLNALDNLNFAIKRATNRKPAVTPDSSTAISLQAVVDTFDLAPLLQRSVGNLSGGERRRIAMARTLLTQPQLLLLDEPLSGLDESRKREILPYLHALSNEFKTPTLYVSHQLEEVTQLCQNIMVINSGKKCFHGSTYDGVNYVEAQLNNLLTTDLSFLHGRVIEHDVTYHMTRLNVAGQNVQIPKLEYRDLAINEYVTLQVKPNDVALALQRPTGISTRNVLKGVIKSIDASERFADITLSIGGQILRSRITLPASHELGLQQGMTVYALLKSSGLG